MHEVVRALTDARAKVARRWIQHTAYDAQGGVCAGHAIDSSVRRDVDVRNLVNDLFLTEVREQTGQDWTHIPAWNDQPARTKQQVLAVFDAAIATAKRIYEEPVAEPVVEKVVIPFPTVKVLSPVEAPVEEKSFIDRMKQLIGV